MNSNDNSDIWSTTDDEDNGFPLGGRKNLAVPVGRRNIRKIKRSDQLARETKAAKYDEITLKLRISEYEKELAKVFPNGEAKERMILDFDPVTKEPIVTVHPILVSHLKEHQKDGICFMWKVCFERVSRLNQPGTGCILAHCMGLGKTLQVIAMVHTILTNPHIELKKVLILSPKNTIMNWVHEFEKWIRSPMAKIRIFNPASEGKFRDEDIETWNRVGGVCILSYTKFRLLINESSKGSNIRKLLLDPGPEFLVCDEGHIIKNHMTKVAKSFAELKTKRRVILSGTPFQNNLAEYYSMVHFVRPFLLGTRQEFSNMFVNPIENGQFHDSGDDDVNLMKARSHVLYTTLTSCVQRFDITTLKPFLKEKREFVITVRLTPGQVETYTHYLLEIRRMGAFNSDMGETVPRLFSDFQALQRIWSHPYSLEMYDKQPPPPPRKLKVKDLDDEFYFERPKFWKTGWWNGYFDPEDIESKKVSSKLVVLFEIIQHCYQNQEKLLIFSQSLFSLRLIEHFLNKDFDDGRPGWVFGEDYFVLTGASTSLERDEMCQTFNDPSNKNINVFLISTKAGGLGITLNAANRAVLFDACWNPSHDVQSIFRIYRLGQKKPCYIYRLIAAGTMEEKIYERQVTKQSTSHRVLDEKQIARHYTAHELRELYEFQPDKLYDNSDSLLIKDVLLAKIVGKHSNLVGGYHEHDSLLQHKLDEELLDIEKKFAWTDFGKDDADVVEEAMAIGKMINRGCFQVENYKIVLRRRFPDLQEAAIGDLVVKFMPEIEKIFALPNFQDLMSQQALRAAIVEKAAVAQTSLGKPIREWGRLGDRTFGPESDSE